MRRRARCCGALKAAAASTRIRSYMAGGKQYVAIAAGHALLVFSLE